MVPRARCLHGGYGRHFKIEAIVLPVQEPETARGHNRIGR